MEQIFLNENDDVPVDNVDMCVDKIGAHGVIVLGIGAGDSKRKPQPAFLGPWKYKHFFCETTDKFPSPTNLHDTMQRAVQMVCWFLLLLIDSVIFLFFGDQVCKFNHAQTIPNLFHISATDTQNISYVRGIRQSRIPTLSAQCFAQQVSLKCRPMSSCGSRQMAVVLSCASCTTRWGCVRLLLYCCQLNSIQSVDLVTISRWCVRLELVSEFSLLTKIDSTFACSLHHCRRRCSLHFLR